MQITLKVFDIMECKRIFEAQGNHVFPNLQLCAGGEEDKDSCGGDSGGGLYAKVNNSLKKGRYNQVGFISWGPDWCGTAGKPGVYIKLRSYLPWILDSLCKFKK